MKNKKKKLTSAIAVATALTLLVGGTFAWQSISQVALNEKEAIVNPGGRLHDDFDGENKDVYVENFASDDIFARVRLDEYFEITMNKGTPAEKTDKILGTDREDTSTYVTHIFDTDDELENADGIFKAGKTESENFWNWKTGGKTVYMPTFNKNKDSLKADINGTMSYKDADGNEDPYGDYVEHKAGDELTANATYDNDSNSVEDDGVTTVEETHYAKDTAESKGLISMAEWLELNEGEYSEATHANYWVYDTDGWCYWSSPIKADSATGLLLDGISLADKTDDSYYYAINVVGQFITADDLGREDGTGFYDSNAGKAPTSDALTLLGNIGVNTDIKFVYSVIAERDTDENYDLIFFSADSKDLEASAVAKAVGVDESKILYSSVNMNLNLNVGIPYDESDSTNYADLCKKVSSVRFANEVKPEKMTGVFLYVGNSLPEGETPSFDFTNLDTSNVKNFESLFSYANNITSLDLSDWDTSNVENMGSMFANCSKLTDIKFGTKWDTAKVTNMRNMFFMCKELTDLDIDDWDTSNVTDIANMFYYCQKLKSLDLSNWDTSKVTSMRDVFNYCQALTSFDFIENWNTANVTNMEGMFYCTNATDITFGDGWDTSKVTTMKDMFWRCYELETITFGKNWDTSNVTTMYQTFRECEKLQTINFGGNWDTSNVTDMFYMFVNCKELTTIPAENWNTSKVTNMIGTFQNCNKLTLDCSKWDTSSVTDHKYFSGIVANENITEPTWQDGE